MTVDPTSLCKVVDQWRLYCTADTVTATRDQRSPANWQLVGTATKLNNIGKREPEIFCSNALTCTCCFEEPEENEENSAASGPSNGSNLIR